MDRRELLPVIDSGFSAAELQELCFQLGVEYENLSGETKTQKVIELIGYFDRRGELARLERAARIARPGKFRDSARPAVYKSQLNFPLVEVREALTTIARLSSPDIWPDFAIVRSLTQGGWMGSDSDTVIDTLYTLYRPIVIYQLLQGDVERSFSLLDWRTRIQFIFLEFAGLAIVHDYKIAALNPGIEYTPRVRYWRQRREEKPQQYWWQGLSTERFEKAVDAFCTIEANSEKRVLNRDEFREYYKRLFQSGSDAEQQNIGLVANALYGFTPATRPVYWRLFVIQARLYQAILASNSEALQRPTNQAEVLKLFEPPPNGGFPFVAVHPDVEAFEPFETTFNAATQFLELVVAPQTSLKLNVSQYRNG